jgi:hypothetical protein
MPDELIVWRKIFHAVFVAYICSATSVSVALRHPTHAERCAIFQFLLSLRLNYSLPDSCNLRMH